MSQAGLHWVPTIDPRAVSVDVDGDVVVIDWRLRIHLLNSTAAALWALVDGTVTVGELATDVADVFAVDLDRANENIRDFAEAMVRAGIFLRHEQAPDAFDVRDTDVRGTSLSPGTAETDGVRPRYLTRPPDP